jgi:hypothetical protein
MYLAGYVLLLTHVGRRQSAGVFAAALDRALTLGQDPPGAAKLAEAAAKPDEEEEEGRLRRFLASVQDRWDRSRVARQYTRLVHGDPPPSRWTRIAWFVFVGWWFAGGWTFVAWLAVLPPYPFVGVSRTLIAELPSLLTLERPRADLIR